MNFRGCDAFRYGCVFRDTDMISIINVIGNCCLGGECKLCVGFVLGASPVGV